MAIPTFYSDSYFTLSTKSKAVTLVTVFKEKQTHWRQTAHRGADIKKEKEAVKRGGGGEG